MWLFLIGSSSALWHIEEDIINKIISTHRNFKSRTPPSQHVSQSMGTGSAKNTAYLPTYRTHQGCEAPKKNKYVFTHISRNTIINPNEVRPNQLVRGIVQRSNTSLEIQESQRKRERERESKRCDGSIRILSDLDIQILTTLISEPSNRGEKKQQAKGLVGNVRSEALIIGTRKEKERHKRGNGTLFV